MSIPFDINRTPGIKPELKAGMTITDVTKMAGNVPEERKRQIMTTFDSFIRNGDWFSASVGKRLVATEISAGDEEDKPLTGGHAQRMKFVAGIEVTPDMVNKFGFMHGGCTAYLMDSITTGALVCLEGSPRVSLNLNISFHGPAPLGTKLKLVAYTTTLGRKIASARAEMWDDEKALLLASATHTMSDPKGSKL